MNREDRMPLKSDSESIAPAADVLMHLHLRHSRALWEGGASLRVKTGSAFAPVINFVRHTRSHLPHLTSAQRWEHLPHGQLYRDDHRTQHLLLLQCLNRHK